MKKCITFIGFACTHSVLYPDILDLEDPSQLFPCFMMTLKLIDIAR